MNAVRGSQTRHGFMLEKGSWFNRNFQMLHVKAHILVQGETVRVSHLSPLQQTVMFDSSFLLLQLVRSQCRGNRQQNWTSNGESSSITCLNAVMMSTIAVRVWWFCKTRRETSSIHVNLWTGGLLSCVPFLLMLNFLANNKLTFLKT